MRLGGKVGVRREGRAPLGIPIRWSIRRLRRMACRAWVDSGR